MHQNCTCGDLQTKFILYVFLYCKQWQTCTDVLAKIVCVKELTENVHSISFFNHKLCLPAIGRFCHDKQLHLYIPVGCNLPNTPLGWAIPFIAKGNEKLFNFKIIMLYEDRSQPSLVCYSKGNTK